MMRIPSQLYTYLLIAFFALPMGLQAQESDGSFLIDFEKDAQGNVLAAGMAIGEHYAAWGVHISAQNNRSNHPNAALVFDSSNPSGGDQDLGTPHQSFGGPGKGEGGTAAEGLNNQALGNLLILAENMKDDDGDGIIDNPDDEAAGGKLLFRFDQAVNITGLVLVDIDKSERGALIYATQGEKEGLEIPLKGLGDNSVVRFENTNWNNIDSFEIRFPGSGAVAELRFEPAR